MKSLIDFWKTDVINKLIVGVAFLLLAGIGFLVYLLVSLSGGKSLQGMFSGLFTTATPTVDVNAVFTSMAQTAIVQKTPAYLRDQATPTPGGTQNTSLPATATPSPTSYYTSTPSPTPEPTAIPTVNAQTFSGVNCVPFGTPKKGRVLDILDGVSAKIFMDDLVYTVHYIGVDLPAVAGYADAAAVVNGQMVYGRDVMLYEDPAGKDTLGLLSRYIVIDGKLVNLELIKLGLATVVDVPSGFACHQAFLDAEAAAKAAKVGQWK